MSDKQDPLAPEQFLKTAVSLGMLKADQVRELNKSLRKAGGEPGRALVEQGRLTPIQAEAVTGLLRPDSIAEGYQVEGLLGHGGIGIVYRARQPQLDRVVALKTISTARLADTSGDRRASTLARFQQEARLIAKLQHPNIVAAYDYGAVDDRLYLAMEMVEGVDLETHIRKVIRLDEQAAWQIAAQVAAALAHAAESGVTHRDIKPANLLLTDPPAGYPLLEGTPFLKVTDFGLARFQPSQAEDNSTRLTVTGVTMGTPHYMAPEQIDDAKVGLHADIYALGATVFHMIAGEPPFAGMSTVKIFAAKLSGDKSSMDELPEDVSHLSRRLLADMLQHKAKDRPQDYRELLTRIEEVFQDDTLMPTLSMPTPPELRAVARRVQPDDTVDSISLQSFPVQKRPRLRGWKVGALATALPVLLAAAVLWLQSDGGPPDRKYMLSPSSESSVELIGQTLSPPSWRGFSGGQGRYLGWVGLQRKTERMIGKELEELGASEHFALVFRLAVMEDVDAIEVRFDYHPDGSVTVLRVDREQAVVGVHPQGSTEFRPTGEPFKLITAREEKRPIFELHRDSGYWHIYQIPPGEPLEQRIAWTPVLGPPPDHITFRVEGTGEAYLGDFKLFALAPIEAGGDEQ